MFYTNNGFRGSVDVSNVSEEDGPGDPIDVTCGYEWNSESSPEQIPVPINAFASPGLFIPVYEAVSTENGVSSLPQHFYDLPSYCVPQPASTGHAFASNQTVVMLPFSENPVETFLKPWPQSYLVPAYRPNVGTDGRAICLRANHFNIRLSKGFIYRYMVTVSPDKLPEKVKRQVFDKMVTAYPDVFKGHQLVFDGREDMYCKELLSFKKKMVLKVDLPVEGHRVACKVIVTFVEELDMSDLKEAFNRPGLPMHEKAVKVLDAIMQQVLYKRFTQIGESLFPPEDDYRYPVGAGKEIWLGFRQSVKSCHWNMSLNVDMSATEVYKKQTVIELLCHVLGLTNIHQQIQPLNEAQRQTFEMAIQGLKIEVICCGNLKDVCVVSGVTRLPALLQFLSVKTRCGKIVQTTVPDFFLEHYGVLLQYPLLPCLQASGGCKFVYMPLELCHLIAGQRSIRKVNNMLTNITFTKQAMAISAPDREKQILKMIDRINFKCDPVLQAFGINVDTEMTYVPGRVLPAPTLLYGPKSNTQIIPQNGLWNMGNSQYLEGVEIKQWAVVSFAPATSVGENELRHFLIEFHKMSWSKGMPVRAPPCFYKYVADVELVEPTFRYMKNVFPQLQLVIVILPYKNSPFYPEIKRVGDVCVGLTTQCVLPKNVNNPTQMIMVTICSKINSKLGGVNNALIPCVRSIVLQEPVIFMGGDVSHSECENGPSVAAVVGSVDGFPSRYTATVRAMVPRQEIIEDLTAMVTETLMTFYQATALKPARIVFYRDGVNEPHFNTVLQKELQAVRKACMELESGYEPGITFIVVQKGHHTRLFCTDNRDQVGKCGNIPPGTIVDQVVTHQWLFDFYLCSHFNSRGTSRPSHYVVLWDDNNFSADDLQNLTFELCFMCVRCQNTLSVPAPLYYSHLAAARGTFHLAAKQLDRNYHSQSELQEALTLHPDASKVMYFA